MQNTRARSKIAEEMLKDEALFTRVRDAIFLSALGSWEESCAFEELSEEGKQIYADYAKAAIEAVAEYLEGKSNEQQSVELAKARR